MEPGLSASLHTAPVASHAAEREPSPLQRSSSLHGGLDAHNPTSYLSSSLGQHIPNDFNAFVTHELDSDHDDDDGTSVPPDEYTLMSDDEPGVEGQDEAILDNFGPNGYDYIDEFPNHSISSQGLSPRPQQINGTAASPFMSPEDERLVAQEPSVNSYHGWPLFAAMAPPVLTVLGGRADYWSNAVEILLTSFWLYQFLRSPWELYDTARTRRVLHANEVSAGTVNDARTRKAQTDHRAQQAQYQASLQRAELLAFLWCILSPVIGAATLVWLRDTLSDGEQYINAFSIRLFLVTAGIKPWMHAIRLLRRRLLFLQKEVNYPAGKMEALTARIEQLESDLARMRANTVSRAEMDALREALDIPLARVVRAVRKAARRDVRAQAARAGELARVDGTLAALVEETSSNAEQIQLERKERERWSTLPGTLLQAIGTAMGQRYGSAPGDPGEGKTKDLGPSSAPALVSASTSSQTAEFKPPRTPGSHRRPVGHKRSSTWSESRSTHSPARAPSPTASMLMNLGRSVLAKARDMTGRPEQATASCSHSGTSYPAAASAGKRPGRRSGVTGTPQTMGTPHGTIPHLNHQVSSSSVSSAHMANPNTIPLPPVDGSSSGSKRHGHHSRRSSSVAA